MVTLQKEHLDEIIGYWSASTTPPYLRYVERGNVEDHAYMYPRQFKALIYAPGITTLSCNGLYIFAKEISVYLEDEEVAYVKASLDPTVVQAVVTLKVPVDQLRVTYKFYRLLYPDRPLDPEMFRLDFST